MRYNGPLELVSGGEMKEHFGKDYKAEVKDEIWERDGGICVYCGNPGQVVDHVVPLSKGGPALLSNGVLACRRCNTQKSNRLDLLLLARAFYYLLSKGASLEWLDDLWRVKLPIGDLQAAIHTEATMAEVLLKSMPSSKPQETPEGLRGRVVAQHQSVKGTTRDCAWCKEPFEPRTYNQRYCCGSHRQDSKLWYKTRL